MATEGLPAATSTLAWELQGEVWPRKSLCQQQSAPWLVLQCLGNVNCARIRLFPGYLKMHSSYFYNTAEIRTRGSHISTLLAKS